MDLNWDSLQAAHATLKKWRTLMSDWGDSREEKFDQELSDALTNDLDTPRAMQRLRSIEKDSTIGALDKRALFIFADHVLALDLDREIEIAPLTPELEDLLLAREKARADKDWAQSDALREELENSGLEISDGKEGQSWRWK